MLKIPLLYIKDKQVFTKEGGILRLVGKPLDVAKELKKKGYKLLHIVDLNAITGRNTNLDVYDGLTYFINVQVECAPKIEIISKLMVLKCRVVLPPAEFDIGGLINSNLMVCKVPKGYGGNADLFRDVILESFSEAEAKRFTKLGKRIIIHEAQMSKKLKVWGVILSHF
ncbi:Uncharacterised protein [Candidatus Bilamarchaeum dharawalense]|uniref:Uncharacterized protein n=1 Tax=Candidatus Bilamarchaeum dharawalense TaxID=2885759 RepID=A0A5E4LPT9_9ARCH|nr:Uncharacterised protein [Candidatus Bilamarchaeum dharawalense]